MSIGNLRERATCRTNCQFVRLD